MSLLQQQMTRYHDQIRPRYSNPTYSSTNIGSTLGMHLPMIYRNLQNRYSYSEIKPASRERSVKIDESPVPVYRRSNSQLSNIGTNSLKSLNRYISDKQVYEKQQKNYNIINVQPKEYEDSINIFPKYRFENEDRNYFKKLQLQRQISDKLNTNKQIIKQLRNNPQNQNNQRGKYLKNVSEVKDLI